MYIELFHKKNCFKSSVYGTARGGLQHGKQLTYLALSQDITKLSSQSNSLPHPLRQLSGAKVALRIPK